ncbi:class I SAM-dependent DNA methyltransferase [Arundinibacter roseus]|uniref:site-specific DNA-methyltransferase (adenine-specific) n=1 Tax=Arundinibacter roseus TaxID=2070510 RepID=A0A4R4KLB8_9BACT|nr:DNA methyltransferase [Arundinibacter roseus]TDB69144.1 class I SAM-dependent DNA methyltransferase [Arundinibacter roseus]
MNSTQIESNVQQLIRAHQPDTFIYDLLLAYGQPKASIKRLQIGSLNLAKQAGEIAWKKKLYYREIPAGDDLNAQLDELRADAAVTKHDPRFIVVTDHRSLAACDRKTQETICCTLTELPRHFDFFLPWAGMEKTQLQNENPADVKAAEKMARLYDEIRKDNPTDTPEAVHGLNVFLSRLLFCFFAEDTGIFEKAQFTNAIGSHTQTDGSDLHAYLDRLFEILNTPARAADLPAYLTAFPYVNGGLFRNRHHAPVFTRRSRQAVIDSGELDWSAINPDIFGSMIQAVITPEHRGGLGMHYTSVPNIMKVIEPLFLNELHEEFEAAQGAPKKLNALLTRMQRIKLFDPACGSGNFLIIAYKELRRLEMKIFRALNTLALSNISLSNFYGIELDDFAHEVAILSLWLAEHQMNQEFFREFGRSKPSLPLTSAGHIVHGNACRLDWESVCPKLEGDEVYILGNPPYLGYSMQNKVQKEDIDLVFKGLDNYKNLDYIACWFLKGANFIQNYNAQFAYVSTNSICQGEQVACLWRHVFIRNLEIGFAHTSFKWANNAKSNAGVIVAIIGVRNLSNKKKFIFRNSTKKITSKISPYLIEAGDFIIQKRSTPLSQFQPILRGSGPIDDGNLILDSFEKDELLAKYPSAKKFIKRLLGAHEFINGFERWCLWIEDNDLNEAKSIPEFQTRIKKVELFRLSSNKKNTRNDAINSHRFSENRFNNTHGLFVPRVSSERRVYIPFGFVENTVIVDSAQAIYDPDPYLFSILTSRMHMTWVRAVAGRLKTDYRYSNTLCYNTFPFPPISETQKQELEGHVYNILGEREAHSEKTLAQLYDPEKMPAGLREAHRQNDLAVERCYRSRPFESDEERLEYLFKLYEQMIAREQEKGTLFEGAGKRKRSGTLIRK